MKRRDPVATVSPLKGRKTDAETQLRVRLPDYLHRAFLGICREQDKNASQVIRSYIREYVRTHAQADIWGGK